MGVVIYIVIRTSVYEAVDDNLDVSTEAVVSALEPLNGPLTNDDIARNRVQLLDEVTARTFFEIRDPDGELLYSSVLLASAEARRRIIERPEDTHLYTQEIGGQRLRTLYTPIIQDGQNLGTVEVAQSLNQADKALTVIRNSFIVGGLVTLAVTAVSAYSLAGRALDPVRQVSRLARHIEQTSDFSRRLPGPSTAGEMRELVETFNAMIERVDRVVSAQQEFLADSAHELRRPLTLLRANIEMINDPALPVPEREAVVKEIQAAMQGMGRLVSDLLTLSRDPSRAIQRKTVDLSSISAEAMTSVRSRNQTHQFVEEIDTGLRVLGDAERLSQLVSNLLDNAVRYGSKGGKIQVRLMRFERVIRLEVEDEGPGIRQEEVHRIFERFYRGDAARRDNPDGTGLGLAIVKYLAEAHGGSVAVRSEPGRSSIFTVDLPAL
jgi:signal transduction histidine kinase